MRTLSLISILILAACGGTDTLFVEDLRGDAATEVVVSDWSIDGKRDGASTRAVLSIQFQDGRSLNLNLLLAYNPEPVLAQGSWTLGGESGPVKGRSIRFVGGQGEGPSVGGDYELILGEGAAYLVRIPLTKIDPPAPQF